MHKSGEQGSLDISNRKLIFMAHLRPFWMVYFKSFEVTAMIFILDEEHEENPSCMHILENESDLTWTNISSKVDKIFTLFKSFLTLDIWSMSKAVT